MSKKPGRPYIVALAMALAASVVTPANAAPPVGADGVEALVKQLVTRLVAEDVAGAGALIVPSALLLDHVVCGVVERGPRPLTDALYSTWAGLGRLAREARKEAWTFASLEMELSAELRPGDEVPEASCAATAQVGIVHARARSSSVNREGEPRKAKLDVELIRIAGRWYFVRIDD